MHYDLADTYRKRTLMTELILVIASVLFCTTTFAGDNVYKLFGLEPAISRAILGVAAVGAFAASLVLMLVDWRGAAARHLDAAERWSAVVRKFREAREDGWPTDLGEELANEYWDTARNSAVVPDKKFTKLKARYRRKVEVSKLVDANAAVPHIFLESWVVCRAIWKFILDRRRTYNRGGVE